LFPVLVSCLWGLSTPFLQLQSKGIEYVRDEKKGWLINWLRELGFIFLNWKYMVPFACNQLGSILFVFALQSYDLSLIVPFVNSLTFVFVFIGDVMVADAKVNLPTATGIILIASGIALCIYSKL
jgi:drug/metabolite transporter (DMT)-like permease